MHRAFSPDHGRVALTRSEPRFNVCDFHITGVFGLVSTSCDADAAGALAVSREGAAAYGALLLAPDMSTPAATATAKLKYAGALLADMILGLLSSQD